MRKIINLFVLFLLIQSYSYATNYYISASNTVTSTNLKTIDDFNKKFNTSADCVFFKRGETFRGQIKKSAKFYGAYGTGVKPKIMGSELLTGWTVASGSGSNTIWKANYKSKVYQLFADTARQVIARWPNTNTGFDFVTAGSVTSLTASGIPAGVVGATVRARVNEWAWQNSSTVTAQSGNTLTLQGTTVFASGMGFCLDGVLPLLDTDNEWVCEKASTGYDIYFNPSGFVDPNTLSIEGSVYFYAFGNGDDEPVSDGITEWNLSNLYLDNLDIRNQAWMAVWAAGGTATNNKILNCDFRGQNQTTLLIFGNSHNVENCTFKNTLGNAIYLYGTKNIVIKNNTFYKIAEVPGMGRAGDQTMIAVVSDFGVENYIGYNTFDSIGSGAVYTSGLNVMVEKNIIRNTNLYTNDQGSIYTIGTYHDNGGTVITNNYIYRTSGSSVASKNRPDAHSIYLDGITSMVTVTKNTIVDAQGVGILNNGGGSLNTNSNNVIYGAEHGLITFGASEIILFDTIVNNELYALSATQPIIRFVTPSGDFTNPAVFSGNYYINPYVASANNNIHVRSTSFASGPNTSNSSWNTLMADDGKPSYYYGVTTATDKSQLFSNLTDVAKTYTLSCAYKDLNNADITTFTLQPFTSRILINPNSCSVVLETTDAVANNIFSVYPNPTEGSINITSKNGTDLSATLYNYTGTSLVKVNGSLEEVNSKINEVFANQKAGLYIIHLNDGIYTSDLKVVKK